MTDDLDIYRAAHALNVQHGADAPIQAAMNADAMLEAGDIQCQAVWMRILVAVDVLASRDRPAGTRVH